MPGKIRRCALHVGKSMCSRNTFRVRVAAVRSDLGPERRHSEATG